MYTNNFSFKILYDNYPCSFKKEKSSLLQEKIVHVVDHKYLMQVLAINVVF